MQKIEDAVSGVLDAMRQQGIGDYSIQRMNWSIYRRIINWHCENGTDVCSIELLNNLCEYQKERYERGEISRNFYRSFVTAAFRIRSYVITGKVDFSIVKETKRYRPNEFYQELTEAILNSTGLKAEHQKRLAAHVGLERLVVAGNDVGACFPGVFLCVLRPKRGKRDISRQVSGRIFTLVLTEQRFQFLIIHVSSSYSFLDAKRTANPHRYGLAVLSDFALAACGDGHSSKALSSICVKNADGENV